MANAQRTSAAQTAVPSRRQQDIIGLLLFFFGAAGLLSLSWSQPGLIPEHVNTVLRLIAGIGAYALPVLLMCLGAMYLIGYERLTFTHASFGSILFFIVFVTATHMAKIKFREPWDSSMVSSAGGWIGGLVSSGLDALCGRLIAGMFIAALAFIALVLLVDQPLIEIMKRVRDQSKTSAQVAQRGIVKGAKASAAFFPSKQDSSVALERALPPAKSQINERDERAAKVANRALGGHTPATSEPVSPTPLRTRQNEPKSPNLFNLFSIARTHDLNTDAEVETVAAAADDGPFDTAEVTKQPTRAPRTKREPVASNTQNLADSGNGASDSEGSFDRSEIEKPFVLPPLTLLKESPPSVSNRSPGELTDRIRTIEQTLEQFNIGANVVEVASGPSVTRYEIILAPGIKVSKIVSLADNLAMSLAAIDVRVEAPIPGKSAIGLEVPNSTPTLVSLRECLDTDEYRNATSKLTIALGKDVAGQYKYADLTKMPHLLIGGSTNSGKSVCLNTLIASLLYRASPREVKMLMIDPKRVELSLWDGIPHLMYPVVTDVKQAAGIFTAAIKEMEKRYDLFKAMGTRNIDGFNQKVSEEDKLAYIVLIVDELADLMMLAGPEIENSIQRLTQLARATGIHLVIATQRPSVDVITGTIKSNISSRIAFAVASQVDSRTILDMGGADRLVGKGDMLFLPIDASKPTRIQGCYLSESETNALVTYLSEQEKPEFSFSLAESSSTSSTGGGTVNDEVDDQFFEQAVRLVVNNGQASTSMLQRRFRIGYTRAARIVEMMEEKGIVGPLNGAKPREICISRDQVERMFNPGGTLPSVNEYQDEE